MARTQPSGSTPKPDARRVPVAAPKAKAKPKPAKPKPVYTDWAMI